MSSESCPRVIFHGFGSLSDRALGHLLKDHYLHRKPPMCDTFEMRVGDIVKAVLTTGVPASRHMQVGACPSSPSSVVELNRLWVASDQPHGTASWFISQCLRRMPPRIVLSYADTAAGHDGTVYRAANFFYAGWTDMDRKTPRFDYVVENGRHTRDAFRKGEGVSSQKVRRKPKARYWTVTGNKKDRRELVRLCQWPVMCWKTEPVPTEHKKRSVV